MDDFLSHVQGALLLLRPQGVASRNDWDMKRMLNWQYRSICRCVQFMINNINFIFVTSVHIVPSIKLSSVTLQEAI
jgi:hypothetical protein